MYACLLDFVPLMDMRCTTDEESSICAGVANLSGADAVLLMHMQSNAIMRDTSTVPPKSQTIQPASYVLDRVDALNNQVNVFWRNLWSAEQVNLEMIRLTAILEPLTDHTTVKHRLYDFLHYPGSAFAHMPADGILDQRPPFIQWQAGIIEIDMELYRQRIYEGT